MENCLLLICRLQRLPAHWAEQLCQAFWASRQRRLSIFQFVPFLLLFGAPLCAFAGENAGRPSPADSVVSGKVVDARGPLSGVSVSVLEREATTVTDSAGNFSLPAPSSGTLRFSFVGYNTQTVAIGGRSFFSVTMVEGQRAMEEIIVIGYGTQSKEKVIGSVAQISGDRIADRPVTQLKNALAGQLPGVIVTQRSGRPGTSNGAISVRGVGSFGASPAALILVDGIPVENFNDLDPATVETISVLKDASSAAIYGSRAANGVILVTTKNGKSGKPQLAYNSYVGFQRATNRPDYINSWEYQQAYYEADNGSSTLTAPQLAIVEKYRAQNDPNYPNTRFLDAILSKDGLQTGHNLSISGGSPTNTYNVSLGYVYQNGLVVRNDYARYTLRSNLVTTFSPKWTLTTRLATIITKLREPLAPSGALSDDVSSIIGQAVRVPNTLVGRYDNGDFGLGLANSGTPISDISSPSFYKRTGLNLNGNLRLDYKLVRSLKFSFIAGYVQDNNRGTTFKSTQRLNAAITTGPNFVREGNDISEYYTLQGLADFSKQIGRHYFGALVGYSFEDTRNNNFNAFRDNILSNDLNVLAAGSPTNQQSDGTASEFALESQFARASYNYAGRYLIEGVVRRDGSSRFPTSEKYAIFPSAAVGWRLGQEKFVQRLLPWVSELKLKASYGTLGNQNIANYAYKNRFVSSTANSGGTSYTFGGVIAQGATRRTIVDTTLHWESTRTKDIGVEAGFFKNTLTASATYFDRYTYDILYSPASSVSNILGFALSQQNTGKLKNTGWEFTLNHLNNLGKFSYTINTNLTILRNRVIDLGVGNIVQPNGLVGNGSDLFLGYPGAAGGYNLYYGYISDGLFRDAADIAEYQKTADQKAVNPAPKPGDIRFKDISGPNGVPDGVVNATYDRVVLGSQIPKYSYGANLSAGYAGFDVSVLLQGIGGVKGRLQDYAAYGLFNTTGNIQRWQYEGRWTAQNPDPNAIYPRLELVPGTGTPNTVLSSFWILNASYLRVKNLQVGYTFSKKFLSGAGISSAKIYVSGENLHTFSRYEKGWDPEINGSGEFYPILTTYTVGLNLKF